MGGRPVGGAQRLPSALYLPTDDYVPVYLTVYHGVSVPVAAAYAGARQEVPAGTVLVSSRAASEVMNRPTG